MATLTEDGLVEKGFVKTSNYHPEGPTYTKLIGEKTFNVCPWYNMVDVTPMENVTRRMGIKTIEDLDRVINEFKS